MRKFKNLRSIQEADAADYVKKPDDDEEATDYKPRSDGEAEFAAKHKGTTEKHPHADENQFKAVDVDHVDHKDAESDNVDGEKQPVKSGTKTFSNFRQATQTPLRRGDKRQGDFKTGSVKEEVELDEAKMKPYVSSDRDGKHVMTSSGKIAKTFKDMDSANQYLKKNYDELMKEEVEFIEEAVKAGTIKLENGKSVKVTKEDAAAFNAVLKELNPENRKRMESEMMKDEKSYKNMLTFAKRTV